MTRKIALRSLKNLCTFIGAIALFSYFYNWTVDTRHWYFTLASAFVCSILWLGFCMVEVHKDRLTRLPLVAKQVALGWLSDLRTKPEFELQNRSEEHTSELQSQSNLVCRLLLE